MAKRKKASKPKRAKLRRGNSAKRSKPRKVAKSVAAKRAKLKRAPLKKMARGGRLRVVPATGVIERPASGGTEIEANTGK